MGDSAPYIYGHGNVFTDLPSGDDNNNINSSGFLDFPSDKQNIEEDQGSEIDTGHEISSMSPLSIGFSTEELDVPNEVPPFNRNDFTVTCISSVKAGTRSKDKWMNAMEKWVRYNSEDVKMVTDQIELPKSIIYFFIARYTTAVLLTIDTNGKLTCLTPETRSRKEEPGIIYSVFELKLPNKVTTSTFTWTNEDKVKQVRVDGLAVFHQVQINIVEKKEEKGVGGNEKKKGKIVRDDIQVNFMKNNEGNYHNDGDPMDISKDTKSIDDVDVLKSKRKRKHDQIVINLPSKSVNTVILIPPNIELMNRMGPILQTNIGMVKGSLSGCRQFWYKDIVSQHRNVLIQAYGDSVPNLDLVVFLEAATEVLLIIVGDNFQGPLCLMKINETELNWTQKRLERLQQWPCNEVNFNNTGRAAQEVIIQIENIVQQTKKELPISGLLINPQERNIEQQLCDYLRNWLGSSALKEVPSMYFICLKFSSARLSGYTQAHAHQVLDNQIGTDSYNRECVVNGCVAVCISGTDRLRWLLALQYERIRDKLLNCGLVLESISELCLHDVEHLIVREDNEPYREQLFDMLCRMQGHGIPRYFDTRYGVIWLLIGVLMTVCSSVDKNYRLREKGHRVEQKKSSTEQSNSDEVNASKDFASALENLTLDEVARSPQQNNSIVHSKANKTEEKASQGSFATIDVDRRIELQVISGHTQVVFSMPLDRSVEQIATVKIENVERACIATAYDVKQAMFHQARALFTEDTALSNEIRIAVTWKDDTHSVSRYYLTRLYADRELLTRSLTAIDDLGWKYIVTKMNSDICNEESSSLTEDQQIRQCIKKELLFILRSITAEDLNCFVLPKQRIRFVRMFWEFVNRADSIDQHFIAPLRGKSMDWIRRVVRIYHFVAFENWVLLRSDYIWPSDFGNLLSISAVHLSVLLSLRADEGFSVATYYTDAIEAYLVTVLELMQSLKNQSPTTFMTWAMYLARIRYMRKNGLFNEQTRGHVRSFFGHRLRVRALGERKTGADMFVRDYSAYGVRKPEAVPMLLIESYMQNESGEEEKIAEHIIAQDNVEYQSHSPFLPKFESNDKAAKNYYPMTVPSSEKPVKHQVAERPPIGRTALENLANKFNYEELGALFEGTIATYKADLVPKL